jgi:hypothetical protein
MVVGLFVKNKIYLFNCCFKIGKKLFQISCAQRLGCWLMKHKSSGIKIGLHQKSHISVDMAFL